MSGRPERHSPTRAALFDGLKSPLEGERLDSLHQPQPRPPELRTCFNPQRTPRIPYVDAWLETLDEDRKHHSKSDSHLTRISRLFQPTGSFSGSVLEMPRKSTSPDATPEASSASNTSSSLVGASGYRSRNLAHHGIHFRGMRETLPEHIQRLVNHISRERKSPEPEVKDVMKAANLLNLTDVNGAETVVTRLCQTYIFQDPMASSELEGLYMTNGVYTMRKEHLPTSYDPETNLRLSQPKPDLLYGYIWEAFTSSQQRQLRKMHDTQYTANMLGLIYPFFVVEFKGDAPGFTTGSLWAATNQCLGAAAACINMIEKLNRYIDRLDAATVQPVDTTVFSIAMNGSEARLFVSWKEADDKYYTQQIKGFLVYDPEHYLLLLRYVRNVLEWGKDIRLPQIGAVLDAILEGPRKRQYNANLGASANPTEYDLKCQKRIRLSP